jgi:excisionase family DNA binding protein
MVLPDGCLPKPDTIRVNIAAKLYGCTERHMRRLIQNGEVFGRREGQRHWLVQRADVERISRKRSLSC